MKSRSSWYPNHALGRIIFTSLIVASMLAGLIPPPLVANMATPLLHQVSTSSVDDLNHAVEMLLPGTSTAQAAPIIAPFAAPLGQTVNNSSILTVTKMVDWNGNPPNAGQPFAYTITGPNGFTPVNDTITDGGVKTYNVPMGVYTVTESAPGAGWTTVYTATPGTGGNTQATVTVQNANTATLAPTAISGTVFQDFNSDGQISTGAINDTGVSGVQVTAYNKDGAVMGSAITDGSGNYTINPTGSGPYRIEFSNLPAGYEPTTHGIANGTSTQFVTTVSNASNVNLGINQPQDYTSGSVGFAVSVMRASAAAGQTNLATRYGYISLPYNATGNATGSGDLNNPDFTKDVPFSTIGAVWGAGYQRFSGIMYAGAIMKRHQGLGPLVEPAVGAGVQNVPADGIYMIDYDGSVGGAYVGGFTLNGVTPAAGNLGAIDTGVVQRETINTAVTAARPFALSTTSEDSFDVDAFNKTGKIGFGDVEIGVDETSLWVVNLNQKSLIHIDVSNPAGLPTSGAINGNLLAHYAIDFSSLPTCTGEYRPWGLNFHAGFGYVGVVCDAASGSHNNLHAHVLRFDPETVTGFTSVVDINLDPATYVREAAQYEPAFATCALGTQQGWNRWANSWADLGVTGNTNPTFGGEAACPQPILSGIAFAENGDMILGFMDRTSLQLDRANLAADTAQGTGTFFSVDSGGDTIHVCNTTGGFVVEGAAGCVIDNDTKLTGDTPTTRFSVTDGPNGQGEFYYNDYSSQYDSLGGARHVENNLGSVTVLPGSNQVLVTGYDVIIGDFNQGFHWYETRTGTNPGARVSQYQLSVEGANDVNTKGMGLGDIELLVAAAPIEIGNRVWDDLNGNGIQDPGEPGLNGVTVTLETPTGANSTVTSGDGNYYFAVEPYTPYTVTIGTVAGYQLTVPNAAALDASNLTSNHAISDTRDSDALLVNNVPTITYTTGGPGQNNHGLDFGFVQPASGQVDILNIAAAVVPPSIAIEKRLNTMAPILPGEEVNFTINITNTGSISITSLPLTDTYDLNYLTFDTVMDALGPNPATEATNDGSIYWANVIDFDNDGQFDPNEVLSLTVSFNAKAATTGSNGGVECEPVGYTYNKASTNGEESCVAVQIDPAPGKSTLGDFVWYDVNGDGIKDAGEQGIDGVRVELYEVVDLGGGITETQFITFQITGPDRPDVDSDDTPTYGDAGAYDFAVLDNKIYQVVITDTNFLPGGALENYVYTGENASEPYSGPAPRTVAIGTQEDYNDADFPFTQIPSLQVTKVLNGVNPFGVGMPVSFSIRVTNTGGVTITTLPLEDRYSSVFIAYDSATPAPDSALDGVLIWNDLLASLNDTDGLGAGESVSVDVMFTTGADTTLLSAIAPCVEDGQAPNLVWVNNAMADTMPVVMDADDSDCASVQILNPTGIQLAEHSVQQTAAGVLVRWRMVEETNVVGFYVWRVNGVESSRRSEMILTQVGGQQSNGAAYEWLDAGATLASGDTYVLEIVYTDGAVERTVINVVQGVSLYLPLMQR